MSFDDLPAQAPINSNADAYAAECLRLSRAAATGRCALDVRYGEDYWQKLDIYLPSAGGADLPVLLFMHGGGWTHGYKEWCGFMAPALVDLPAILVSVSYRLIPAVSYPAPAKDCVAALKWVYDNIGDRGGARDRLFVGGHSAGGQIAALMALHGDWLAEAGLPADVVKGVFCISTTFNRRMVNPAAAPDHVPKEPFTATAPDSPLALAERARTPFLITWGGKEDERLERTGRQMIAALERAGCPVESRVFPEDDHFSIHLNTARRDDWWTQRVREMMSAPAR
ncbi:MAG: alpha/beta hydrolase [Rhodospirillaceae bacterium]|nr:alpha/beta hydrolase [Rhodospirillaceae bacterium]